MCTYYVAMMPSSKNSHFVDADETWRVCFHAAVITPVPWSLKCTLQKRYGLRQHYDQPQRELTGHRVLTTPKYDLTIKWFAEPACSESIKQAKPSSLYLPV